MSQAQAETKNDNRDTLDQHHTGLTDVEVGRWGLTGLLLMQVDNISMGTHTRSTLHSLGKGS